jgi:hypothetical protein
LRRLVETLFLVKETLKKKTKKKEEKENRLPERHFKWWSLHLLPGWVFDRQFKRWFSPDRMKWQL